MKKWYNCSWPQGGALKGLIYLGLIMEKICNAQLYILGRGLLSDYINKSQ